MTDVKNDEETYDGEPLPEGVTSLAEAAASALSGDDVQGEFEETESTKVKFVGMQYDAFEESIKIGDEVTFTVRARCSGVGDEYMASSGNIRHYVKMDVQSVVPEKGLL